jgi:hypothetical protein
MELISLLPALLVVTVLLAVLFGPLRSFVFGPRRRGKPENEVADPKRQLEFVSKVAFETQPLLNKSEFQVLLVLEAVTRSLDQGFRVMAQTSLGEILRPRRSGRETESADLAYRSINSKRVDFVIVDRLGMAIVVVEYQGDGHYQGTALLRDAVKREALRTAGVALIEVPARFNKDDVAGKVREALRRTGDENYFRAR